MHTSSQPSINPQAADLKIACRNLLGRRVLNLERIGGGRNSQVYRLQCEDDSFALKCYFQTRLDQRNRLKTEFSSLQFLWRHGLRCIPQPLFLNAEMGFAIYEYIDGQKIAADAVSPADIDQLVRFLLALEPLKIQFDSQDLGPASEACFSIQSIFENLEKRLHRLMALPSEGNAYEALHQFLQVDFLPALKMLKGWSQARLPAAVFTSELPLAARTLSPSDFGFHNALQRTPDNLIFLDLEYFGWDDPAKMISDFLLHPAMQLDHRLKQQFVQQMFVGLGKIDGLVRRVETVYPLFGLKWCLILLNEFVPTDLLRRAFANQTPIDKTSRQFEQLAKAQRMLSHIMEHYEQFLYHYQPQNFPTGSAFS